VHAFHISYGLAAALGIHGRILSCCQRLELDTGLQPLVKK
jgi:hypothetical protein